MAVNILTGNEVPSNPSVISGDVNIFASNGDPITLGQQTMAQSIPVVFASNQTALPVSVTFPSSIGVTQVTNPWVVSGNVGRTWVLNSGTDSVSASVSNFPVTQDINLTQLSGATPSATNSLPSRISNGTIFVDPTQIRLLTASDQVTIANASIAVTGTVTANQGGAWIVTANIGTTNGLALDATLTNKSQFTRLTDGTNDGAIKAGSSPALAADPSLVVALSPNSPLPSGTNIIGALSANQSVNLNQYGGVATSLGQKPMATSIPVTVASDQSTLPISAASLPLPTGAATSALQTTGNASLASIDSKLTNPLPISGTVTANQGGAWTVTANAGTNLNTSALALSATQTDRTQFTKLTDGTRDGTLKAASTAAVAADTSLVVAVSPNSPLPTGSNVIGALAANQSVNQTQINGVAVSTGSGVLGTGTQRVVLATDQPAIPLKLSDGQQLDAFGRLRVSNPDTIFDNNFRNSLQALLWSSSTATGGTVTHVPNSAAARLAVTASSGSSAIYQTRRYFPYNAGKSQLIIFTGVIGAGQANTRKRYGYFDANDGIFFEQDGTTLEVVRRTSTSGVVVDNAVAQASWNLDKLDGTGASGFTLDVTKANIFFIDFEWLGVGRIRMGVANPNGGFIYCHEFINANQFTVPYMRTGALPMRAEITNTAGAAAISNLDIICQTVISEGGNQRFGTQRSSSRAFTLRTVNTSYTPLISMRLKAANITAVARLIESGVFGDTADNLNYSIIVNPATLTGATWAVTTDGETVEVDIAATALTGGTVITNGYVKASAGGLSTGSVNLETALNAWLGSTLAGVADVFTLAARCSTGTADVAGFLTWLEL